MSQNHRNRLSKLNGHSAKITSGDPQAESSGPLAPQEETLVSGSETTPDDQAKGELLASLGPPTPGVTGQELSEQTAATTAGQRRGRPTVMDADLKSKVCLLLSVGLSRRQAATYLEIVHTTIANAMQRDEEFAASVLRAEQMSVIKPMLVIAQASQKNWRAATWLLARNERRVRKSEDERQEEKDDAMRQGQEFAEHFAATLAGFDAKKGDT